MTKIGLIVEVNQISAAEIISELLVERINSCLEGILPPGISVGEIKVSWTDLTPTEDKKPEES